MDELPDETLAGIFCHVDLINQFPLRQICQRWKVVLDSQPVKRNVLLDYGSTNYNHLPHGILQTSMKKAMELTLLARPEVTSGWKTRCDWFGESAIPQMPLPDHMAGLMTAVAAPKLRRVAFRNVVIGNGRFFTEVLSPKVTRVLLVNVEIQYVPVTRGKTVFLLSLAAALLEVRLGSCSDYDGEFEKGRIEDLLRGSEDFKRLDEILAESLKRSRKRSYKDIKVVASVSTAL